MRMMLDTNKNDGLDRVLLIDLENCPDQIYQLKEKLEQFSQVVICYAQTGVKIPLDWLVPLSEAVNSNRLRVFKMTNGGKNAADFGICFFAGVLMQQLSQGTHFIIISNDTDLDHVVNLLKGQGRSAERMGNVKKDEVEAVVTAKTTGTKDAKTPSAKTPSAKTPGGSTASPIKIYCMHLVTYSKNRPGKKDTLLNSIKNKFKDSPESAAEVFRFLTAQGAITISDKKISYNDKKIMEFAG